VKVELSFDRNPDRTVVHLAGCRLQPPATY
jgi:hypothetical protein